MLRKDRMDEHALSLSVGAWLLALVVLVVGAAVAPSIVYDQFVWKDIYGPLAVDAHQCRSSAELACASLGPAHVVATDRFTLAGQVAYGAVLVSVLYAIHAGVIRRHQIATNGWLLAALLPWVVFGAAARALEDANAFCAPGTSCTPSPLAYGFINPVIFLHVALYVVAALLLGAYLAKRRANDARKLTGIVAGALAAGLVAYGAILAIFGAGLSAIAPLWVVILGAAAGLAIFHWRASRGLASVNVTVFALGLPFAAGALFLVGAWISGDVWAPLAWSGHASVTAAFSVVALAALVTLGIYAGARSAGAASWPARHASASAWVTPAVARVVGWAGGALVASAIALSLAPARLPAALVPALAWSGVVLLCAFALVHTGHVEARRPQALLLYASAMSLALVFAHVVDGLATWFAHDDPFGFGIAPYGERHPVGERILGLWGGILFPAAKLLTIVVVLWLLARDPSARVGGADADDVARARARARFVDLPLARPRASHVGGLVLISVFVIGIAPGLRDVLRIAMGV